MDHLLPYLEAKWFALALILAAVALGSVALWRQRGGRSWLGLTLLASTLAALGAGGIGLTAYPTLAVWLAVGATVALLLLFAVVILSGHWSALLGYALAVVLLTGLGAIISPPLADWLAEFGRFLVSLTPLHPWWLLLLLVLPFVIGMSVGSLSGLGRLRRGLVIGLRCLAITFLVLALADAQARRQNDALTVLFAYDVSMSIPQEKDADNIDQRRQRIVKFVNDSVAEHGRNSNRDLAGLIVFGHWPRLESPPAPVLKIKKITSDIDRNYTDIGAAIKLALACFPEGTNKRIVLISDGNENLGNAEEQALLAKRNGVQIDVVPLAAGRDESQEVIVLGIVAPPVAEKDARVLLHVTLRSYSTKPVEGTLTLSRSSLVAKIGKDGKEKYEYETAQLGDPEPVTLFQGLNPFTFQAPPAPKGESYVYRVKFTPKEGTLPGDRPENNEASTQVVAKGQRAILLIEPKIGDHELLVKRVKEVNSSLKFFPMQPESLPQDPAELTLLLSKFDAVILANVPKEAFTEDQEKAIRANTHDQGCGLVMIGGPNGFGAGGWQNTEIEKSLPVTCELKATKVAGKGGLVLIMHASEIQAGVTWQKKVAQLAVEKLSPIDMVGLLYFDFGPAGHTWHIPFQQVGPNKDEILRKIDTMFPGDMPDFAPSLQKAYDELTDPKHNLTTKHIIFISDGDHWQPPLPLLAKVKAAKITVSTVCITSHGQGEYKNMEIIAKETGGRAYPSAVNGQYTPLDPQQLPQIYTKESRLVSKSFIYNKTFQPFIVQVTEPAKGLANPLKDLQGCVLTTKRDSPLVDVPIQMAIKKMVEGKETKDLEKFPILAHWQYGLGKSVAFTSDARTNPFAADGDLKKNPPWDLDWANSTMYGKFWEQVIFWSLRSLESGTKLTMTTEQKDGKIKVIVKAQDDNKVPLTDVQLEAGITSPSLKGESKYKLHFEQTRPGIYEAEIKAEEDGSYFINIKGKWKKGPGEGDGWNGDSVRAGVTIPYPPEFAEMNSNLDLLRKLADITGGKVYEESSEVLEEVARNGDLFRPVPVLNANLLPLWPWLVLLAAVSLVFDAALRRLAFDTSKLFTAARNWWARLRGHPVELSTAAGPFLSRLQTRKSQVGRELEQAGRRFEGEGTGEAPGGATDLPSAAPGERRPAAPRAPGLAPQEKEPEAQDYASRLMRAKKKVWKERDKEK